MLPVILFFQLNNAPSGGPQWNYTQNEQEAEQNSYALYKKMNKRFGSVAVMNRVKCSCLHGPIPFVHISGCRDVRGAWVTLLFPQSRLSLRPATIIISRPL